LDDVLAAWRFVYDCHAHDGSIRESRFRLHTTAHAAGAGTAVLLGESGGRLIATVTIVRDGQRGLALDARFPRALGALRATGKRLSELGLMAHSGGGMERLLAVSVDYALRDDYSALVAAVPPSHCGYYQRVFGFTQLAGALPTRRDRQPLALMYLDRAVLAELEELPSGLLPLKREPLPPDFYAGAFGFLQSQLSGSELDAYLVECRVSTNDSRRSPPVART
jgi:hypothetical protein